MVESGLLQAYCRLTIGPARTLPGSHTGPLWATGGPRWVSLNIFPWSRVPGLQGPAWWWLVVVTQGWEKRDPAAARERTGCADGH